MTTSHFHAFLPPTLPPLGAFKPNQPISEGLIFYELPPIPKSQLSSSSLAVHRRQLPDLAPGKTQRDVPTPSPAERPDEVESFDDSIPAPIIPSKRPREEVTQADAVIELPTETQLTQPRGKQASGSLGPRRSTRTSRASGMVPLVNQLIPQAAFLTAPTKEWEETFQTLNTTATSSQLSQPRLPNWSVPLSKLVSLHTLLSDRIRPGRYQQNGGAKVSLMVCVMAVEALQQLKRKEGKANGRQGTLWLGEWRVTVPPEGTPDHVAGDADVSCPVKLWDKMAKEWGDGQVRRGDVMLLESMADLVR